MHNVYIRVWVLWESGTRKALEFDLDAYLWKVDLHLEEPQ
jgi:hypothetical protein